MKINKPRIQPIECPFCGELPEVEPWHNRRHKDGTPAGTAISCANDACAIGPMHAGYPYTRVVREWNTRRAVRP